MTSLRFENIAFGYKRDKRFFDNLSFEIKQPDEKGYVIGLTGGSGSGKSTILKLILKVEKPYQGKIYLSPENPVISYVPQESILFDHLTPLENATYLKRNNHCKSKFNLELFTEVAQSLQIQDVLEKAKSVSEISGGQRQQISLLRAISIQPDFLLLDEPLTGLDEEAEDQFLRTLATIIPKFRLMVIYVTRHCKEAEFISNEILYLKKEQTVDVISEVRLTKTELFFNNPPMWLDE